MCAGILHFSRGEASRSFKSILVNILLAKVYFNLIKYSMLHKDFSIQKYTYTTIKITMLKLCKYDL